MALSQPADFPQNFHKFGTSKLCSLDNLSLITGNKNPCGIFIPMTDEQ